MDKQIEALSSLSNLSRMISWLDSGARMSVEDFVIPKHAFPIVLCCFSQKRYGSCSTGPSLDVWKVRFRDVQRIATVTVLMVDQELAPYVLCLYLVPFWVIRVAARKFEFTAVKRWPDLPGHIPVLSFSSSVTLGKLFFLFLYISFFICKMGQYSHSNNGKTSTVCLILTFLKKNIL